MIKPEFQSVSQIIKATQAPISIPQVGEFFWEPSYSGTPAWIGNFFGSALNPPPKILSANARGLLLTSLSVGHTRQYFAISFGLGRHLLRPGVVEERFGLKVVLNSVAVDGFRSISKTTLGSVPKHSHEQIEGGGDNTVQNGRKGNGAVAADVTKRKAGD